MKEVQLYIVPTPIGNLDDITLRAIKVLQDVDIILAEDTRKTGMLLKHHQIEKKKLFAHHQHNEHKSTDGIIKLLKEGQTAALVSNAGTPLISDPGYTLVKRCTEEAIPVSCLPGATAIIPALVCSGMPTDKFLFLGFLPHKKGRKNKILEMMSFPYTCILYESPNRIIKTLEQIKKYGGDERIICIAREISKVFEEFIRGHPDTLISHFRSYPPKGEFILLLQGKNK